MESLGSFLRNALDRGLVVRKPTDGAVRSAVAAGFAVGKKLLTYSPEEITAFKLGVRSAVEENRV